MWVRRLQKVGGNSLGMTLPKQWVIGHGLEDKSEVVVRETRGGLLIVLENETSTSRSASRIDAGRLTRGELAREFTAAYISGAEKIVITGNTLTFEQMAEIRRVKTGLVGLEVTEMASNQIVLTNLFDQAKLPTGTVISNLVVVVRRMFSDVLLAMWENNPVVAREVVGMDDEADKLHNLISRQSNQQIFFRSDQEGEVGSKFVAHFYYLVSGNLERMADHAVNLGHYFLADPEGVSDWMDSKPVRDICQQLQMILGDVSEILVKPEKQSVHKIIEKCSVLEERMRSFSLTGYRKKPQFSLVVGSLGRVRSYVMNIAEHALDLVIRQKMDFKRSGAHIE